MNPCCLWLAFERTGAALCAPFGACAIPVENRRRPGARLVVQAQLASLVFATQGNPPYTLWAGADKAAMSALPVATLVPALDDERARFGRATLGEWSEVAAVARAADQQKRLAALRPWLLWTVLLAGVAGLGFMVWRPTRAAGPAAG